jgi:hypothetical protein
MPKGFYPNSNYGRLKQLFEPSVCGVAKLTFPSSEPKIGITIVFEDFPASTSCIDDRIKLLTSRIVLE